MKKTKKSKKVAPATATVGETEASSVRSSNFNESEDLLLCPA
jgi:hypothetical protein